MDIGEEREREKERETERERVREKNRKRERLGSKIINPLKPFSSEGIDVIEP
jgi:hypothetical protein